MVNAEKNILEKIVEMAACKNREPKSCWVIEGGSFGGNCKYGFGKKKGGEVGR